MTHFIEEAECEHPQRTIRRFTASNGVAHFRWQCLECGANVKPVAKRDLVCDESEISEWNEELRLNYWNRRRDERQARYEAAQTERSEQWWQEYTEYLNSPEWLQKRALVLSRDAYQCRAAINPACEGRASQVHHLSYKHVGSEPLFDLVAVCENCHDQITALDRASRAS